MQKKLDNLSKEKEELSKENQSLLKQLEDYKQGTHYLFGVKCIEFAVKFLVSFLFFFWQMIGLRGIGDAVGEHVMKEKEKEKDTRIQVAW